MQYVLFYTYEFQGERHCKLFAGILSVIYILSPVHAHLVVLLWFLLYDQSYFIKNNLWTSKLVMVLLRIKKSWFWQTFWDLAHLPPFKTTKDNGYARTGLNGYGCHTLLVKWHKIASSHFVGMFFRVAYKSLLYSIIWIFTIFKVKVPVKD